MIGVRMRANDDVNPLEVGKARTKCLNEFGATQPAINKDGLPPPASSTYASPAKGNAVNFFILFLVGEIIDGDCCRSSPRWHRPQPGRGSHAP